VVKYLFTCFDIVITVLRTIKVFKVRFQIHDDLLLWHKCDTTFILAGLVPGGCDPLPAANCSQDLLQRATIVVAIAVVVPATTVVVATTVVAIAVVVPATTVAVVVAIAVIVPAATVVVVSVAIVVPAATVAVSTATIVVPVAVVVPATAVAVATSIQQLLALVAVEFRSAAGVVAVHFSLELSRGPAVPACCADRRGSLNSCPAVPAAVAAPVSANQIADILQVAPPLA